MESNQEVYLSSIQVRSVYLDRVKVAQRRDPQLQKILFEVQQGQSRDFIVDREGTLRLGTRLCVPDVDELRKEIMKEAHFSAYSIHPGSTKMYHDLKDTYWWNGMKRDIAEFVSKCLTCQQVKLKYQSPSGLLQQLPIPKWKWDMIAMDFLCGFPRTSSGYDAIWVIVDRLTKTAHFLPIRRRTLLTGWKELQEALGTRLDSSTAFHP